MSGPLNDVRVVSLAGMGPGPFAAMLLADLGAEVVRIQRPEAAEGPEAGESGLPPDKDIVTRGVVTVEADLKAESDLELVKGLSRLADVFMEGFRPGVAERLGVGPDALAEGNPRLIYARLTGYGQQGPLANAAGHDINYVAQAGVLGMLGRRGERPTPPVNLLGDYAGGGLVATIGIISALYERESSGRGQVIDAAMIDGVALLSAKLQGLRAAGQFSDQPGTNWIDTGAPFYDTYLCADGKHLAVGALEPRFYAAFVAGLGIGKDGLPAQDDVAGWPVLREKFSKAIALKTRAEWLEIFRDSDACVAPVYSFDEAAVDPHNRARGLYASVDGVLQPAPAPRFSRTPVRSPGKPGARESIEAVLLKWNGPQS